MKRPLAVIVALSLAVLAIAAGGCGSSTKTVAQTSAGGQVTTVTVPDVHFAKTKFVAHMALAVGAFHHYVYKPLTAGALSSGAPGRTTALLKAGVATLFAVHELKLANTDALSDARLRPLAERIDALLGRLTKLGGALNAGSLNPAAILGSAGAVSALAAASGGLGASIREVVPAL
jgi:hypothetical protein